MNESQAAKKPTHGAFHVRDIEGGDGFWNRIGSAWPHKDGLGFHIQVDTFPLDGKITLRVIAKKDRAAGDDAGARSGYSAS